MPKEEWEVFPKEFWGPIHFQMSGLPEGEYEVEMGFCEGFLPQEEMRVFDVVINGRDGAEGLRYRQGGGRISTGRDPEVPDDGQEGKIDIVFTAGPARLRCCRLRVYNAKGELVAEERRRGNLRDKLQLAAVGEEGQGDGFWDWLYHKECVAKAHPVFEGLQAKGIMDWDYYGPVISHKFFEGQDEPAEVIAACFGPGIPTPEGYLAGIMMSAVSLREGEFHFEYVQHSGQYRQTSGGGSAAVEFDPLRRGIRRGRDAAPPRKFEETMKAIGYAD